MEWLYLRRVLCFLLFVGFNAMPASAASDDGKARLQAYTYPHPLRTTT